MKHKLQNFTEEEKEALIKNFEFKSFRENMHIKNSDIIKTQIL